MKKKRPDHSVFKRIPKIKDAGIRAELSRAHLMVALLSLALAASVPLVTGTGVLSLAVIVALALVSLFSLAVVFRLSRLQ